MNGEVMRRIGAVCLTLAAAEFLARLCPENDMLRFVRALVVLALGASVLASLFSMDWQLGTLTEPASAANEELSDYIADQEEAAFRDAMEDYLTGLLAAGGLEAEKMELRTYITAEGSIVLTGVSLSFAYPSQRDRARILLENVLGNDVILEVTSDGA